MIELICTYVLGFVLSHLWFPRMSYVCFANFFLFNVYFQYEFIINIVYGREKKQADN